MMIRAIGKGHQVRQNLPPRQSYSYVGTRAAIRFIRKHHGLFPLPPGELFSFAQNVDAEDEAYVLVGDADASLELTTCRTSGELGIADRRFDALQDRVRSEAAACRIEAPYSVTFATRTGVFSYPQVAAKKREVA